jgi:hypothetical protein
MNEVCLSAPHLQKLNASQRDLLNLSISISGRPDVMPAREGGRRLAATAGFAGVDLAVISTAISDLARDIAENALPGMLRMAIVHGNGKAGIVVDAVTEDCPKLRLPQNYRWHHLMDEVSVRAKTSCIVFTMKKWTRARAILRVPKAPSQLWEERQVA